MKKIFTFAAALLLGAGAFAQQNIFMGAGIDSPVINEDGTVTVNWSENKYTVSYQLYYSNNKKKSYKVIATVEDAIASPAYIDTGVKAGKTYYYKVRTFRVVDGVRYYSAYTSYTTVKIPKS